jgi:predicted acetyltransferase
MLINPLVEYEKSYIDYIEELGSEERYPYPMDLDYSDFASLVKKLWDYSNGINLLNHMVPNTTFWLVEHQQIVGCSHIRHTLNDSLKLAGGHIGLGVRPSYRNKGLGLRLLLLTIEKAQQMGISEIHIHCYESNNASKRIIEAIGANLHSTVELEDESETVLRYIYARTL